LSQYSITPVRGWSANWKFDFGTPLTRVGKTRHQLVTKTKHFVRLWSKTPKFGVLACCGTNVVRPSMGKKPTNTPVIFHGTSLEQNSPKQDERGGKMVHVSA
jgi:hypothetical protein